MKDLDQTKVYKLEKLNTKQFLTLLSRVNLDSSRFIGMENPCIVFYNDLWNATEETMQCEESVDARELFEEEKEEPIFKDNPHLSVSWSNIEVKYEIV